MTRVLGFMLLLIVFSVACTKEKNCVVKRVTTINEVKIDSTYVELECF